MNVSYGSILHRLIVAGVVIVAAVVLLFLAKRAYDNFYVIRHQRKTKKNDKMTFS